jgi:hypothetical protein
MTIPSSYIGHKDFLNKGILKEFYAVNEKEASEKWVQEDILDYYKNPCMCTICNPEKNTTKKDFRVHLVRVTAKNVNIVQNACISKGVSFRNHTSTDRLSENDINELFIEPLTQHIVLGVKGFFRRANLIPNRWKLRIGATLELYTKIVDNNVQIQGLVGRMTGYWRVIIEDGHITGPYRTSIKAVEEYEKTFNDPFGVNSYQTAGFKKIKGNVNSNLTTMLSPKHISNLESVSLPKVNSGEFERGHRVFNNQKDNEAYAKVCGAKRVSTYTTNDDGFKMCSTTTLKVHSLAEILKFTTTTNEGSNMDKKLSDLKIGEYAYRRYVCYEDINDKTSERFVTIWVKRLKAEEKEENNV